MQAIIPCSDLYDQRLGRLVNSDIRVPKTDEETTRSSRRARLARLFAIRRSTESQRMPPADEPCQTKLGSVIATSTPSYLTKSTVCQRCKTLPKEMSETRYYFNEYDSKTLAVITPQSIHASCSFCLQLKNVLECLKNATPSHLWASSFILRWTSDIKLLGNIQADFPGNIRGSGIRFFPVQNIKQRRSSPIRREFCPVHPDYQFIRSQLKLCQETHGQPCRRSMTGEHILRVIDCKSRQLTTVKPGEPYICLSYVWGSGTTQDVRGFGDKLPASVPKTVEDAMDVAINLGIPYLWVDRYCIDQGNAEEKHRIIKNMNRVYEQAEVTIIAAIGDDPHHGLPGVRGTFREKPLILEIGGVSFVLVENTPYEINKTKWSSRAWTYQEMLLSRRRLVFTKAQMFFQCRKTHCMEIFNPASDWAQSLHLQCFPSQGIGFSIYDLQARLEEYYMRQLSLDRDTVLAFDGIVNAFDESEYFPFRVKQFYGVLLFYPDGDNDQARKQFISNLCWYVSGNGYIASDDQGGRNLFPSWSWASTKASHLQGPLMRAIMPSCLEHNDEIEICLTSKEGREMNLSAFIENANSHEEFLPSIKMTTWVLQYSFSWTHERLDEWLDRTHYFEFGPREDCHTLYLAYLGANSELTLDLRTEALILDEFRPGVFRRVGLWRSRFEYEIFAWTTVNDILARVLEELKRGNYGTLWLPGGEEAISEMKWQRRALTIA